MTTDSRTIAELATRDYQFGFVTEIEQETFPPGLDEGVVRRLSALKGEPDWMTEWRLRASATG